MWKVFTECNLLCNK